MCHITANDIEEAKGIDLGLIECANCHEKNERNRQACDNCGHPLNFPNVNIFSAPYYSDKLQEKYAEARARCENQDDRDLLDKFEAALNQSQATINMDKDLVFDIGLTDERYSPYQRAVREGKRKKAALRNDIERVAIESSFYGMDGEQIVYAALTLNNLGLLSYGDVSVTLKITSIQARATVFSENSFKLYYRLIDARWRVKNTIPGGCIGIWSDRSKIGTVKLGEQLLVDRNDNFASGILIQGNGVNLHEKRENDEFIEVHIFNAIGSKNFERLIFNKPLNDPDDQTNLETLSEKLAGVQIDVL